ncbi:MAG: amidohydrolase family protein [Eubacteriales bacterium]|nr:amidohydrolase family protein [Eubacteriales bacterium]
MKVDMHSHIAQPGNIDPAYAKQITAYDLTDDGFLSTPEEHWEKSAKYTDKTIVFGGKFSACGMYTSDEYVAAYVAQHPDTLIGFMSIDPTSETEPVEQTIERCYYDLNMKGIKTSTFYNNCDIMDERFDKVFEMADRLRLPMIFHASPAWPPMCFTEYSLPYGFEHRALQFPNVKMVIAHMGLPWEYMFLHIVRRYPNLYVDMSAMVQQPWDFWKNLMQYYEWHWLDKVLLGTDFPFGTYPETYDALMHYNDITEGTKLPKIPEKDLLSIAERDTLDVLGI